MGGGKKVGSCGELEDECAGYSFCESILPPCPPSKVSHRNTLVTKTLCCEYVVLHRPSDGYVRGHARLCQVWLADGGGAELGVDGLSGGGYAGEGTAVWEVYVVWV